MPSTTRGVFRDRALLSGLVTEEDLDQAEKSIRERAGDDDGLLEVTDTELANELVDRKLLTTYQTGQLIEGRTKLHLGPYIITDFIGQGGMGQVFKGEHKVMGRECAVKVLPLHKSTPETIANFTREIRTQARLGHPNLVHAYDAGHDGNVHYLVTEYVPGTDLRRLVRSRGRLSVPEAANIIMQAALALQYAHDAGLIHRDVKPGNILVTPDGVAKVSDLGMANFASDDADDPRAGKIVGTADYLAPEQIMNPHDIRKVSDVYSLGCTLYYAVTGKVPFPGGTPRIKVRRHLEEIPWHPRRFNPEVGEDFVEIIADMMEKDPDMRIASAGEVVIRLEQFAEDTSGIPNLPKGRWTADPLLLDDQDTHGSSVDAEDFSNESQEVDQDSSTDSAQITDGISLLETTAAPVPSNIRVGPSPLPPPLPESTEDNTKNWITAIVVASILSLILGISIGLLLGEFI